eukprot:TRINITY_DN4605_c0_g1_i2.p1 TRINITY_DN4605_c0_g1~~TRINITY_DN4605_c0_g1_i2.p1  ORF type:complete len:298 (+),score=64.39 TRINITY_DN4605_c0_g1_i2:51-944(+)
MSQIGEVKVWKSKKRGEGYGFAHCTDGSVVWISGSEIGEGMRLVPGKNIKFDIVDAEGHGNRKQGLNVSGSGVVSAADFTQTKEEEAAAKKLWEDYVENTIKPLAESSKKPAKNNNSNSNDKRNTRSGGSDYRSRGTRGGIATGGRGGRGFMGKHGGKGATFSDRDHFSSNYRGGGTRGGYGYGSGSMMLTQPPIDYRSQLAVIPARAERRKDPSDGKMYTKEEFKKCYNSYREWDAAQPNEPTPKPAGRGNSIEKRIDPNDLCPYTKESFIAEYGGTREWDRAKPFKPGMGRGNIK